ncbi:protein cutoff [Drosophila mauritiana]|uniref:Decapping nuclease n=1 Tax=Drosophila mauritiana TaxID=7226 RepID=A0A6P8JBW0_DROMA|nr:protein cutoff [Drosophila mauritiana]
MNSNYQILNIQAHSWVDKPKMVFPTITKPISIGCFVWSTNGQFEPNSQKVPCVVVPPTIKFPISLRYEDSPPKLEKKPKIFLDNMLQFIESSSHMYVMVGNNQQAQLNANIVCTSEVLELMMCAPYEKKTGWSLGVTRYRNTMYICRIDLERPDPFNEDNLKRVMQELWLRKLRTHCVFENGIEMHHQSSEEHLRFHGVFSFNLNGVRVLFDSPVLAEMPSTTLNGSAPSWVDLQIRPMCMSRLDWSVHNRTEALKWWVKCFLLGIDSLYIAHRDENAHVHNIEKTLVGDLWKSCEKDWSTTVCANFMVHLLTCISQVMAPIDCPSTVYLFQFDARQGTISYESLRGRSQYTFLSDWFRMMLDDHTTDMWKTPNLQTMSSTVYQ